MGRIFNDKSWAMGSWATCSSTEITLHGRGRAMKKVALYFNLKKELKAGMLTLHAMCSVLKMQYPIWQIAIPVELKPLKSKLDDRLAAKETGFN